MAGAFAFSLEDNGGDAAGNVCEAVCGVFGRWDGESINRNEKAQKARFFGEIVCRIGKVRIFVATYKEGKPANATARASQGEAIPPVVFCLFNSGNF